MLNNKSTPRNTLKESYLLRTMAIKGGALIRIGIITALLLMTTCKGMSSADLSTDTRSSDLATEGEQIDFLGRYVVLKSAVSETEFHIVYHDNSGGVVGGPSDWDIRAVMRVEDVGVWVDGKTEVETADFSWAEGLVTEGLRPSSQPTYYANETTTIAVFELEQIVYFRSTTIP